MSFFCVLRIRLHFFSKKELPKFRFSVVPEEEQRVSHIVKSVLLSIYVLMLLCAAFSDVLSSFVHKLGFDFGGFGSLILYILCITATATLISFGIMYFLRYGKIKEVGLKASQNNVEATTNLTIDEDSVLEEYRFDLVYVMEKLSESYDAVVFEDMDRLESRTCISIFSQLRDINKSVNCRLHKTNTSNNIRSLRFIYAVNDELLGKLNQTKFFDYIMSVVPTLGYMNVRDKFSTEVISKLGITLSAEDAETISTAIAECADMADYRILNHIKNDFTVFKDIELKKDSSFTSEASLLAFVIYKVLCPGDYHLIRSNRSLFLPTLVTPIRDYEWTERGGVFDNYHVAYMLATTSKPLLIADCLKFVGYSRAEQKKVYEEILAKGPDQIKKALLNSETSICNEIILESLSKAGDDFKKIIHGIDDEVALVIIKFFSDTQPEQRQRFVDINERSKEGDFVPKMTSLLQSYISNIKGIIEKINFSHLHIMEVIQMLSDGELLEQHFGRYKDNIIQEFELNDYDTVKKDFYNRLSLIIFISHELYNDLFDKFFKSYRKKHINYDEKGDNER